MNDKLKLVETPDASSNIVPDVKTVEDSQQEHARQILMAAQQFIADADALEEVLDLSKPVLVAKQEEHRRELEQVLDQIEHSQERVYGDPGELHRLTSLAAKLSRGGFLFRGHLLVALVSRFDAFVAGVAREMLAAFPERLGKKSLTYAEVANFNSLEELRNKFIADEIDSRMRESHNEQINFLSSLANVQLGSDEPSLLSMFIEITERRNCHIHSGGKASPQYLRICAEHKVKLKKGAKEGIKLNVTTGYFSYARKILSEMAFKISQTIVRRSFPESQDIAELHVTMIGIQLLKEERWEEALVFFDYAAGLRDKWAGDEGTKRNNIINKAQALIGLGKQDAAMKVIESVDWSAAHPKYLLAIHILKNEFKEAAALMPNAGLKEPHYRDWPIFSRFRVTDDFRTAFASLFGHAFGATIDDVSQAIAVIEENKAPTAPIDQELAGGNQEQPEQGSLA